VNLQKFAGFSFGNAMPEQPVQPDAPLVEGLDYTIENGRWIFTAAYLLKRGACCGSGCRHCPYPKDASKISPTERLKTCAQCRGAFPCNPGDCWCSSRHITVEALAALRRSFRDCLCPDCLYQANHSNRSVAGQSGSRPVNM
jgi:hypothetical protein